MKSFYVSIPSKGRSELLCEEVLTEGLKENEALIETKASMISAGTELSRVFEIKKGFTYPVRPGYSAAGTVLEAGEGLCDIKKGDRVFFSGPHASVCRFSRGNKTQGPMIFKLPDDIDFTSATVITLGLVAASGVNAVDVKLGDTAAVFGLGSIGLLTSLLLKKLGADVIAVDTVKSRCEFAEKLGIKKTLCCGGNEQVEGIKELTAGRGADIAVDVTGASAAIENVILSCGRYAQALLLGSPRASFTDDITPILSAIHMRMIRVVGGFNNLNPVFETEGSRICVERNYRTICSMILSGELDAKSLISHVITPHDTESAYSGLMYDKENYRCVVIDWTQL